MKSAITDIQRGNQIIFLVEDRQTDEGRLNCPSLSLALRVAPMAIMWLSLSSFPCFAFLLLSSFLFLVSCFDFLLLSCFLFLVSTFFLFRLSSFSLFLTYLRLLRVLFQIHPTKSLLKTEPNPAITFFPPFPEHLSVCLSKPHTSLSSE